MDQRSEPRFEVDQKVNLVILGDSPQRLTAIVRNASGSGLGLELDTELPAGTALRIDLIDAIVLAEIIYCRPRGDVYFAGVQMEQMLEGLKGLSDAVAEFSRETAKK